MELRQLECFVAVAEELHFRKAGERLGLSSSALSDRITGLETELGVDLFFRTTRQVSLTQAGSELLRDAKKILSEVDKSRLKELLKEIEDPELRKTLEKLGHGVFTKNHGR